MLWQQGSVVIVNLTRNDADQYRYWPTDGAHAYGVFEVSTCDDACSRAHTVPLQVHLVSEHIWCEDYVVRSFYLKNTSTGETRTVTQLHYVNWPENGVPMHTKTLLEFRRYVVWHGCGDEAETRVRAVRARDCPSLSCMQLSY
jgi:receptor-type tyrosine-protein phosphatase N